MLTTDAITTETFTAAFLGLEDLSVRITAAASLLQLADCYLAPGRLLIIGSIARAAASIS